MLKNWCFRIVVLEKTLESPLDCKGKEIKNKYSLQGLMLKLKLQYFGHLIQRTDSLEKTVMLGKTEGKMRRGWHEFEQTLEGNEGQKSLACSSPWSCEESDITWQLNNNNKIKLCFPKQNYLIQCYLFVKFLQIILFISFSN